MTVLKSIVMCLVLANVGYFLWGEGIANSRPIATDSPTPLKLASEASQAVVPAAPADLGGGAVSDPTPETGAAAAAVPSDPVASGKRCVTVGPFKDVSEAARAASTLRGGGYDPRQRVVDGDVWAGVWVYLPVPANRAAGDQMMLKLKSGGIDDALEMPGPADGSVISLGLFSEQKRAQARVAQAQALGLSPAIVDRKRTGNVYWIDLDLKSTDGALNPADLQTEAGRISRLEIKACPSAMASP